MEDKRILSLLGIAQKSGKLMSGYELCYGAIKAGKAKIIIISGDSSDNTRGKFVGLGKNHDIPCIIYGNRLQLGMSIGKYSRTVLVVSDEGLANAILAEYYNG